MRAFYAQLHADRTVIRKTATDHPYEQRGALLGLKIVDPACGSGHFLLAAARRLAAEIAGIEAAPDAPTEAQRQHALREVVQHCIYGVDKNPLAVELYKTALWIETVEPGSVRNALKHGLCAQQILVLPDEDAAALQTLQAEAPADADMPAAPVRKRRLLRRPNEPTKACQIKELAPKLPPEPPAARARRTAEPRSVEPARDRDRPNTAPTKKHRKLARASRPPGGGSSAVVIPGRSSRSRHHGTRLSMPYCRVGFAFVGSSRLPRVTLISSPAR